MPVSLCLEHWMGRAYFWGTHLAGDVRVSEMHQENQTKVRWYQGGDMRRDSGHCDNNEAFAHFADGEVAVGDVRGVKNAPTHLLSIIPHGKGGLSVKFVATHLSSIRTAFAGTRWQKCRKLRQKSICVVCGTTPGVSKMLPKKIRGRGLAHLGHPSGRRQTAEWESPKP